MIAYTVVCNFTNSAVAEDWIAWLRDEHLAEVIVAGALDAEVIRIEGDSQSSLIRCEARYHFADRESFATYEREHAPRLRAEGLKRFPPALGLSYERCLGLVRVQCPQGKRLKPDSAS